MAIAVIGGIIVSTVLSLVVVPSFFLIMDDLSRLLGWMFGRLVGRKDEEQLAMSREELTDAVGTLKDRVSAIENPETRQKNANSNGKNVLRLPPFAAE
jgi:hypothetical protein